MNYLPRKVAHLYQKLQNSLPADAPILNAFRFWGFRSWEKQVRPMAWVVVSYVLLTQPAVGGAGPPEVITSPRTYILNNFCSIFLQPCDGLLVNKNQVNIWSGSEFIHQNRNGVPERTQAVVTVFSESQEMRQQAESKTHDKTDSASEDVWKPCLHIVIAETFTVIGFFVGYSLYEKIKRK